MSRSASGDFSGDFPQLPNDSLSDINKMLKKTPKTSLHTYFGKLGSTAICVQLSLNAGVVSMGSCGSARVWVEKEHSQTVALFLFFPPNLCMSWGALRSLHLTSRILTPSSQVLSSHHSTSPSGPEAVRGDPGHDTQCCPFQDVH